MGDMDQPPIIISEERKVVNITEPDKYFSLDGTAIDVGRYECRRSETLQLISLQPTDET
jgi:hypothetical protein